MLGSSSSCSLGLGFESTDGAEDQNLWGEVGEQEIPVKLGGLGVGLGLGWPCFVM